MKRLRLIQGLFIALFAFSPMLANAEVPSWYPQTGYDISGVVVQIDIRSRVILIEDDQLKLSTSVKAHSIADEFYSLSQIKAGDFIGVDVSELSDGSVEIVEIWLLDKESQLQAFPVPPGTPTVSSSTKKDSEKGNSQGFGVKKQWRK